VTSRVRSSTTRLGPASVESARDLHRAPTSEEAGHPTPYGRLLAWRHTAYGDLDADGDVDATDQTAFNAAYPSEVGDGNYNRNCDADYDGDVDALDQSAFTAAYNAPGTSVVVAGREWSPTANPYGYTTRELAPESLLMHYRARTYHPTLKQFMQRDPLGYVDGPDLYQYVLGNPLRDSDPFGLTPPARGGASQNCDMMSIYRKVKELYPNWDTTPRAVDHLVQPDGAIGAQVGDVPVFRVEATAEVEPNSGTLVKAFPSGTVVQVYLLADNVGTDVWSNDRLAGRGEFGT